MALRENELTRLRLTVKVDEKADGSPIVRHRTFNRVRDTISDADALEILTALGTLQEKDVVSTTRIDEARVMPE
jgi:hypothetical protein